MNIKPSVLALIAGGIIGAGITRTIDATQIVNANQDADQAAGLESECKSLLESEIRIQYQPDENGDYKLYLWSGKNRELVCEEKDVQIVEQGDAINPIVLECRH